MYLFIAIYLHLPLFLLTSHDICFNDNADDDDDENNHAHLMESEVLLIKVSVFLLLPSLKLAK